MINYYLITKPGIIMGNLITLAAGFFLASQGHIDLWLFFMTLVSLALVMASACIFNNYIDKERDRKMARTKNRALVTGAISDRQALLFASFLIMIGSGLLLFFTNPLTLAVGLFGFFTYVVVYSLWKGRTIYGTAIGSIAGSVPPIVGYSAVSHQLDMGAYLLFAFLVFWQMPHFFSIAIYRFEDYVAAKIPVVPIVKGTFHAKFRMLVYIILFTLSGVLMTLFHYTGSLFLVSLLAFGVLWFVLCLRGFTSQNEGHWARQMFRFSLIVITALSILISFS